MSDPIVIRESPVGKWGKYYSHTEYCFNCGERNHCYVLKGNGLAGLEIKCDKCECTVQLKAWAKP